jgi:N-hydroxyarylamine O-acetyltransferase
MDLLPCPSLDLDAYLARIGWAGELTPTAATLEALHLQHTLHIPFENLDILLGRPIRIDLETIQAKLVHGRRGGYCFEHNTLFAVVLERLGFPVTRLAARVRLGVHRVLPRVHMLLQVEADGRSWLADVGFGTSGLLKPIPLAVGPVVRQSAWSYRLAYEAGLWVLQSGRGDDWFDLYAFTLEPQYPVDFEMANHYVSTYPTSRFVQTLTAQRSTLEARYNLRNREFLVDRGSEVTSRTLRDDEEILQVLAETFHLEFPPGTRFRILSETMTETSSWLAAQARRNQGPDS